jgi:AcrR family transcriptional regulator
MASNQSTEARRPYRKKVRARKQDETRRRITEAAVELHRTVGVARTTITEIAERAGVRRMTVYNHFPTDADLLEACGSHYMGEHPPPDPAALDALADPDERLGAGLAALYGWYRETEDMTGNALRDAPLVPALDAAMRAKFWPVVDRTVDALAAGRDLRGARGRRVRAAIRLAADFGTWLTLTRAGLDDAEAAAVAGAAVSAAASP